VLQKSSTQSQLDEEITRQNWEVLDMLAESEVQRPEALVDQDGASEMSEDEVRRLEDLFKQFKE
jgi:hypothetical protein